MGDTVHLSSTSFEVAIGHVELAQNAEHCKAQYRLIPTLLNRNYRYRIEKPCYSFINNFNPFIVMVCNKTISILVDTSDSWIVPFAIELQRELQKDHAVHLVFHADEVLKGDFLFLLGCTSIIDKTILKKNHHNFVVHESALPMGKGWSPLAWQILEGKNTIPIVLFQAEESLDSGPIYLRDSIEFDGTELLEEIKKKQGKKTIELVMRLLDVWPEVKGTPQSGSGSFYRRRNSRDDELDIEKSIKEQFNHLRIVDNEKYPATFTHLGQKYLIKIYKAGEGVYDNHERGKK
jgi:methionyl-tRNA formyltransferase